MSKMLLIVEADTNDADYITRITEVDLKIVEALTPVFDAIKAFQPYAISTENNGAWTHDSNWPIGDCRRVDLGEKSPAEIYGLDDETVEFFEEFVPFGEYGIHTITSVRVLVVTDDVEYL